MKVFGFVVKKIMAGNLNVNTIFQPLKQFESLPM